MTKIPSQYQDLRRYAMRRMLLRAGGYLLWMIAWFAAAMSYNANHQTYPEYRLMKGWRLVLMMVVVAAIGFVLFRVWKLYTDRGCRGVVVSSGLKHTYTASEDPGTGGDYDFRLNTALKIRTEEGKLRRMNFEQKHGFYQYYNQGANLIRFTGLPYPVNTDPERTHGCVCSVCGTWSEEQREICPVCKHTVIDPKDLAK